MNATVKGSTISCSNPLNPSAYKTRSTLAYSLAFVISLLGNFFIVIIVFKTQSLRKPTNYLIANMAMSDLLFQYSCFYSI